MHCFVVCPIGDPDSAVRKRSNGILREVIQPVAEARGYDNVERADHDKAPGVVTEAIVQKLVSADLVVADLHEHNPNVMYEVAIRHATGRPIVQMIPHGESLPFDIGGLNTILYDPSVDGLARWREDLGAAIDAVQEGAAGGENPVSRASLFRALRESPSDKDQVLASLAESVEQLRLEMRSRFSRPSVHSPESRVLLPPDKFVESEITRFLQRHPDLSGYYFMVDARDKSLRVSVLPGTLAGPAIAEFEYTFDWDARGRIRVRNLEHRVLEDVLAAVRPVSSGSGGHARVADDSDPGVSAT